MTTTSPRYLTRGNERLRWCSRRASSRHSQEVPSSRVATLTRLLLLTAAYIVVAKLGLRVATIGRSVTLVWPPTGLALAALILGSRRLWPAVAVGAFVVNVTTPGVGVLTAAAIAVGNTLEAVVGATLVRRRPFRPQLDETRHVLRFALLGAAVAPVVSATIGALALYAGGLVPAHAVSVTSRVWWVGDFMGALVVAPVVLSWGSREPDVEGRSTWETLTLAAALFVATMAGLTQPHATHPYLVFPPLIWAALRFGPRGATAATLTVSVLTVASTVAGRGAFVGASIGENLMGLEAFLSAVTLHHHALLETRDVAAEQWHAIRARRALHPRSPRTSCARPSRRCGSRCSACCGGSPGIRARCRRRPSSARSRSPIGSRRAARRCSRTCST